MVSLPPIGTQFNRLTFIGVADKKDYWLFQCSCGTAPKAIYRYNVINNKTISCGCFHKQRIEETFLRHGSGRAGKQTRAFRIWCNMRARCNNPNNKDYMHYGGRGITYCESWSKFENFIADMGEPKPKDTIERLDVNKGYCPENCIWLSCSLQNRNKRNSRLLTHNGKTQSMAEWAEELGIKYSTIRSRLRYGWTDSEALIGR